MENKFRTYPDELLIQMIKDGNNQVMDYVLDKYKNMVKRKARTMFLVGADTDDLIQEGMIGLYKAIRDYNVKKETSFYTFASLCIDRQIYSAINASNRKKHSPLNTYISTSGYGENMTENDFPADYNVSSYKNPEELIIDKENVIYIEDAIKNCLSTFEYSVLCMYIDGDDYHEIAKKIDKKPKAVDNALQRIKKKVNCILKEKDTNI